MATAVPQPRPLGLDARSWGGLATAGVVVSFSLSSTLVKRAETPGVLVAFWRFAIVSLVWNAVLWISGRRVTMAEVRQVFVPGLLLGLNLAAFFAGATHNSVANAALIGSLSPFLIVPLGAWLFRERLDPKALVFAVVAFGGVALVLVSAPSNGDASLYGNVLGFIAMLLWTGYVTSTRRMRRQLDVATFMATVCPIATLAVLPLALAEGDVTGLSRTGWTYTVLLALLIGVAGNGLMVFAQRTIPIGTIGIAQVVQPALAVVWSYLLLDEVLASGQALGIALAIGGLTMFLLLNEQANRRRTLEEVEPG